MAVRPIDAEKYMELLKEQYLHHKSMGNSQAAKAWQGAMQLLHDMPTLTPPNEPLTLEQLRASPHGKIKDSTLQSICNRANEIACRPPEGEADA